MIIEISIAVIAVTMIIFIIFLFIFHRKVNKAIKSLRNNVNAVTLETTKTVKESDFQTNTITDAIQWGLRGLNLYNQIKGHIKEHEKRRR